MGLYGGREQFHKEMGEHDFDNVCGEGSTEIPVQLVETHRRAIADALCKIEGYADRRIAHYDKREPACVEVAPRLAPRGRGGTPRPPRDLADRSMGAPAFIALTRDSRACSASLNASRSG
jgi:hypothetical protein